MDLIFSKVHFLNSTPNKSLITKGKEDYSVVDGAAVVVGFTYFARKTTSTQHSCSERLHPSSPAGCADSS